MTTDHITPDDLRAYQPRDCCTHECNQGRLCPARNAAHCASEFCAPNDGKHRNGLLTTLWLRLVRKLG